MVAAGEGRRIFAGFQVPASARGDPRSQTSLWSNGCRHPEDVKASSEAQLSAPSTPAQPQPCSHSWCSSCWSTQRCTIAHIRVETREEAAAGSCTKALLVFKPLFLVLKLV